MDWFLYDTDSVMEKLKLAFIKISLNRWYRLINKITRNLVNITNTDKSEELLLLSLQKLYIWLSYFRSQYLRKPKGASM